MKDLLIISRKLIYGFFVLCFFLLLLLFYQDNYPSDHFSIFISNEHNTKVFNVSNQKFLVSSSKCKIPNLDPFNSQAKSFYHPEGYTSCRKHELLTYIKRTDNITTLFIKNNVVPSYSKSGIACCYSNVSRQFSKYNPDDYISISSCMPFKNNFTLIQDIVQIKCHNLKTKKEVYENTHVTIKMKNSIENKLKTISNSITKIINVLFVGIDSISKLNFIRNLPKTYNYLEKHNWISLNGYNKIDDNTFPNLMAILTGFNQSTAYSICNPKILNRLDYCPMLWYDYRKLGYITGYGEDDASINTFNYEKKGFTNEPVDFYFRPYILATEKLKIIRKHGMNYCTGPETSGERILNLAKDFSLTFKDYPNFGFFWMNTFSHNDLNSVTGMDYKIRNFLGNITKGGVLENSIVIFLSDHGIRFGKIRYTSTGWLEERLPFIYLSIPEWFKRKFKNEYNNLLANRNKLTNPYDMHMTLQHILQLSGLNYTIKQSDACPNCKSLFNEIELDRSCEDAAIELHWCTCTGYTSINLNNNTVKSVAKFVINQIEIIITNKRSNSKCAKYNLNKIISASISDPHTYKNDTYMLVVFETKPMAVFEATVLLNENYSLVGGISRLDKYSEHSECTRDVYLKKFCYCR